MTMHGMLERMDERMERIEAEIRGNGQPGMKQQIDALVSAHILLKDIPDRVQELEKAKNKIGGLVASIPVLGGIAEYLFHHGKH